MLAPRDVLIYTIDVRNAGADDAEIVEASIYADRDEAPEAGEIGDDLVASGDVLQPGATVSLTAWWIATEPGDYASWAQVDALERVKEESGERAKQFGLAPGCRLVGGRRGLVFVRPGPATDGHDRRRGSCG